MNNRFCLLTILMFSLAALSCGSSSSDSGGGGGGGDDTPSGTVTISGVLSIASPDISKGVLKTPPGENYTAHILNARTAEQETAAVAADGTFSLTAVGNSHYIVSFLDSNNNYIGTLETGAVSGNTVPVGIKTGADQSTSDLSVVTANTSTGHITSNATLNSDAAQLAYSADGSTIAGGVTGEGSTDYTTLVGATACTSGAVTCPDLDHDGVPDTFDTDNDNNTYADQIDGLVDKCVPGTTKLFVENYPTCTGSTCAQMNFPTPAEVDLHPGELSMYTINLEFTPNEGSSVGDFSYIEVKPPSYIDTYGYVYSDVSGDTCFNNVLWKDCNDNNLKNYSSDPSKFKISLAQPPAIGKGAILENMRVGDTFVFSIVKTDGTAYTCTRKIGIIQKYYPYAATYDGVAVPTNDTVTSWPASTTLGWSLAPQADNSRPKGMTYQVRAYPYSSSGGNCSFNAGDATVVAEGQDITSAVITTSSLPASTINMWGIQIYATDEVGDITHVGPFSVTTAGAKPCN